MLSDDDAAAIRAVYQDRGEWAAVVELRRRFLGIANNGDALRVVRVIASTAQTPAEAPR